jgi:hypothetical protein
MVDVQIEIERQVMAALQSTDEALTATLIRDRCDAADSVEQVQYALNILLTLGKVMKVPGEYPGKRSRYRIAEPQGDRATKLRGTEITRFPHVPEQTQAAANNPPDPGQTAELLDALSDLVLDGEIEEYSDLDRAFEAVEVRLDWRTKPHAVKDKLRKLAVLDRLRRSMPPEIAQVLLEIEVDLKELPELDA